jgi:hypothetical protein
MKHILLFLLSLKVAIGFSQIDKYYGGCYNEYSKDIILTKSGINILGVSHSFDPGDGDIYDILIDSSGNTKWAKTYRLGIHDETPSKIINWNDNLNIIIGGTGNGWTYPYLLAVDSLGQSVWSKENQQYRLRDLIRSKSNELVACGDFVGAPVGYPPAIVTFDSLGNLISSKYFQFSPANPITSEGAVAHKIIQDKDSSFVMAGTGSFYTAGVFRDVVFVIKLDKNKNMTWFKFFHYDADNVVTIINPIDNSYLVSGSIHNDAFVLKMDTSGNVIWLKEYSLNANATHFVETTDHKYLLLGENAKLLKLNAQCDIIWSYQYDTAFSYLATKTLEFNNNYYLLKTSISPMSANYSLVYERNDMLIVKIDTSGNSTFKQAIPAISNTTININTLSYSFTPINAITSLNSLTFIEKPVSAVFTNSSDCLSLGINKTDSKNAAVNLFPNPNSGNFYIEFPDNFISPTKIEVYDVRGSLCQEINVSDKKQIQVNLPENQKGLFIIKISHDNYVGVFKINCL